MPSTPPPSEQITQIFRIISEALSSSPSSSEEEEENFLPHETWKYHGLTGLLASATASDISRYLAATETTGGGGSSSKREVPQNVFEKYPTVGEFRRWIFGVLGEGGAKEEGEGEDVIKSQEPENPWQGIPKPKVPLSVVLQGKVSTASKIVFLFPDGSGAGTAYGSLPDLGGGETEIETEGKETEKEGKEKEEGKGKGGICIIGLNSPFLRQAQNFTCSIERMTRLWYDEVRKLQAQSQSPPTTTTKEKNNQKKPIPYILGGWSAGGYYSYEMAKLLTRAGEIVSTLILIDSPCRLLYEALPVQVVEELTKKGLMGASSSSSQQKKAAPEWLVQHFTSTVLSVQRYQPVAMQTSRVPENVYCIWVEEGLVETSVEESGLDVDVNVRVTRFLLEGRRGKKKKKLESEGWERLLPGAEFGFEYMTGNHFQITQVPHVRFFFLFFFFFVFAAGTSLTFFFFSCVVAQSRSYPPQNPQAVTGCLSSMVPKRKEKKEVVTATAEAVGKQGNTVSILANSPGLSALRERERKRDQRAHQFLSPKHIYSANNIPLFLHPSSCTNMTQNRCCNRNSSLGSRSM